MQYQIAHNTLKPGLVVVAKHDNIESYSICSAKRFLLQVGSRHLWCTSRLGPRADLVSFSLYTADLTRLQVHLYADDIQMYGFCDADGSASFQNAVSVCIYDISAWIRSNRLQLNAAKAEVMWCASSRRVHQVPAPPYRSVSVPTTLRPSAPFETSAFIWTLMRP